MNQKPETFITPLAQNGKYPAKVHWHRDGTVSFRDGEGRWTHHIACVPPSVIMKLDRYTRARLWYRNFKVERAWAEAHA